MRDNFTFQELPTKKRELIKSIKTLRKKDPGGSTCPLTLFRGDIEVGRIEKMVYADSKTFESDLEKYLNEIQEYIR